jgi:hypothetical protein
MSNLLDPVAIGARMLNVRFLALLLSLTVLSVASTVSAGSASASHGGTVACDPLTGHCYEYVPTKTSWDDAKLAAEGMVHDGVPGHLATITSATESSFIVANVPDAIVFRTDIDGFEGGAWIGAKSPDALYNFAWVTGEPFAYTNWSSGEPNHGDNAVHFWHDGPPSYASIGQWNNASSTQLKGYLVEYPAPAETQVLDLDARIHGSHPPTNVTTDGVLKDGQQYLLTVDGNWSAWLPGTLVGHCSPDSTKHISPSVPAGALAGLDASYWYKDCAESTFDAILYSVDGGSTFAWLPRPLEDTYSPSHIYQYIIVGDGKPASFRHGDTQGDNHGVMKITVEEFDPASIIYTVTQGANSWSVTTVTTDPNETAAQYYSYGTPWGSSSNMGTEQDGESQLFLYLDETTTPPTVNLFVTHDKPGNDGIGGGNAHFDITGLPAGATIVTADDNSTEYRIVGSTAYGRWRWVDCCTDGGAMRLGSGDIDITIDPLFWNGIHTWKLFVNDGVDPNDPSDDLWVELDLTEDVTITRTTESADGDGDGYISDDVIGGTDCDDTNPNIYPGAPEVLNGVDDDCDGDVDEGLYIDSVGPVIALGTVTASPVTQNGTATDDADREDSNGNGTYDDGEDANNDGYFDTDTGIASVTLAGDSGLTLSVDPFTPGDSSVSYTLGLIDPSVDGLGNLVVTDVAGNATQVPIVLIANRPPVVEVDGSTNVYYVDWTAANPGGGTASGVINLPNGDTIGVEFTAIDIPTGNPAPFLGAQTSGGINYWATDAPYISAEVPVGPPDSDILQLSGGNSSTRYTVTFTEAIVGPIMPILSLGQGGIEVRYDFDSPFDIVSQGVGHWGGCATCLYELSGDILAGREGHGTIVFDGTYSTFSWVVPTNEVWHGFTFGVRSSASLGEAVVVDEGQLAENTGTATDPDGDDIDLTSDVPTVLPPTVFGGAGTWSWSNTPTDGPDTFTVTITGDDGKGLSDSASFEVVVINVAPTGVFGNDGPVDEGGIANVSFTGQSDPSSDDTTAGFRYAFDFGNDGLFEVGDGTYTGGSSSASAVVPAALTADGDGTVDVLGRIIDKDGGYTDYVTTVVVNNVAPTVDDDEIITVPEGSVATKNGVYSDPGDDEVSLTSTMPTLTDNNDGTWSWTGVAPEPDGPFTYYVQVTGTDDDGASDDALIRVNVLNVAPVIDSITGNMDSSVAVDFSDVGVADTHTATVDWGDGGTPEDLGDVTGGSFSAVHDYAEPGIYTVTVTVTDDDGDSDTATVTIVGTGDCDCTKSQGWWKQQFNEKKLAKGKTEFTEDELIALLSVVNFGSVLWNDLDIAGARNVFDPPKSNNKGGNGNGSKSGRNDASATASGSKSKKKGKNKKGSNNNESSASSILDLSKFEEKALMQTLAAWGNYAKGAIDWNEQIDVDGTSMTFGDLITEVESLLSSENPTKADLERAKDLAEAVNLHDKDNPDCETGTGSSKSGSGSGSGSDSGSGSGSGGGRRGR